MILSEILALNVTWWSFFWGYSVLKHWELVSPNFSFQLELKKGTDCSAWMTIVQSRLTSSSAFWEDKITFHANSLILIQIYSCICLELLRTDLWQQWWTGIEELVFVYTHAIVTARAAVTSSLCSISKAVLSCLETEAKQFDHSPCIPDL